MSTGPLGMVGSAAGGPLAQIRGADVERAEQEAAHEARRRDSERRAEQAAGVGQTEEHEQASDRDADGRRLWESPPNGEEPAEDTASAEEGGRAPRSRDPEGATGAHLDVSG